MLETASPNVIGFLTIRNKQTGKVLVEKKNAIHFGNISASLAKALVGEETGHIKYMAFGSGGTTVSPAGEITYKDPNVSLVRNNSSALYNESFKKEITNTSGSSTSFQLSNSNYADIVTHVVVEFAESSLVGSQNPIDQSATIENNLVFDELALYTGPSGIASSLNVSSATMITHVIFSPIEKSANREIEVDYTIRIQMG